MMGNFSLDISSHDFFWPNFIQGMGMAMTMVPLMTVALATISNQQMGNATGLYALVRNLAGSIGIAVAIAMAIARRAAASSLSCVSHLTPYDQPYQNVVQAGSSGHGTLRWEPPKRSRARCARFTNRCCCIPTCWPSLTNTAGWQWSACYRCRWCCFSKRATANVK
jgi:hypothetical protein